MAHVGGFVWKFGTLGEGGGGGEEGTQARRHVGTEWGPGGKGESADALSSLDASLPFVPRCLRACRAFSSPSVRLARCCAFVITGAQQKWKLWVFAGDFAGRFFGIWGGGGWSFDHGRAARRGRSET